MILSCALLSAQTTIDLGRQSRNVDFSTSSSTKTFKIGYSLPATCSLGETYLRLDGPAGQNFMPASATTFGSSREEPL